MDIIKFTGFRIFIFLLNVIYASNTPKTTEKVYYIPVWYTSIIVSVVVVQLILLIYIIRKVNKLIERFDIRNIKSLVDEILKSYLKKKNMYKYSEEKDINNKNYTIINMKSLTTPIPHENIHSQLFEQIVLSKIDYANIQEKEENNIQQEKFYEVYKSLSENEFEIFLRELYGKEALKAILNINILLHHSTPENFIPMEDIILYREVIQELKLYILNITALERIKYKI